MIGHTVGQYQVTAKLGEGGMGEVYRAHDAKLNRDVALKLLPAAFANDPERLARFRREAQMLAALNHPNIGHIYGFEDSGQPGTCALVLELVEGPTLADLIEQHPRGLPLHDALPIARQIAEALEAAHEQGITHRDLKPANIKVRADGTVKVLDFGLAKALDPAASGSVDPANSPTFTAHATQMGVIVGTAAYMAPEQARGKAVDKRADIWSFGAVLFEMLTGRRAFEGETVTDMLARILEREPDWSLLPANTPPRVRELVHRCLEKDLKKRQRDIGDARIQLEGDGAASSSASLSSPGTIAAPVARAGRMRWALVAAGVLGVVAGGAAIWTAFVHNSNGAPSLRLSIDIPRNVRTGSARLTPDGRAVVIAGAPLNPDGSEERRARLYVRRLDDYELRPLAGTEGVGYFMLSPDGASVAFISQPSEQSPQRQIARVPIDGSAPPVKVADWDEGWATEPIWLSDGDILIVSDAGAKFFRLPTGGGPRTAPLALDLGGVVGTPWFVSELPGGRGVFFGMESWGARGYQLDAWLLDPKTGKATRLFENAGSASYQPTGHVVFTRGDTLMAAPFDLDKMAVSGEVTALFSGIRTRNSWAHGPFTVSADGTLFYAPGGRVGLDRQIVAIDTADKETLFGGDRRSYESTLAVSRDGRRVAAVVPNDKGTYETWVIEQGRPAPRRALALTSADCADPVWSPDGRRLAFQRTARDANDGIYVQSADGSGEPQLVLKEPSLSVGHSATSWAPDNSALLLTKEWAGKSDLMILTLPASGAPPAPRVLLATPYNEAAARFSADGKWIAFQSDESGRTEVYVAPFANGALGARTMVSNGGGESAFWTGDGRKLFYYRAPDNLMSVAIDPAKGGAAAAPVVVHNLRVLRVNANEWTVMSDGRILAIQKTRGEDDVTQFNVVMGWLDQLDARMKGRK